MVLHFLLVESDPDSERSLYSFCEQTRKKKKKSLVVVFSGVIMYMLITIDYH